MARIFVEGVFNRPCYLDNEYLALGSKSLRQQGTFTEQYTLFSGQKPKNFMEVGIVIHDSAKTRWHDTTTIQASRMGMDIIILLVASK